MILKPVKGMQLTIYPMLIGFDNEDRLCTDGDPDYHDFIVHGEDLNTIYYEKSNVPRRRLKGLEVKVIKVA